MQQETNQRRAQNERLTAEENRFPTLQQTPARRQAEARMMARIQAARHNNSWSVMQKQLEKQNAELEYNVFLHRQAQARAAAAHAAAAWN
jgi:hypothetical protein